MVNNWRRYVQKQNATFFIGPARTSGQNMPLMMVMK